MIDNLALGLSHGLLMLAAWRLLTRPDLDDEAASPPTPATKAKAKAKTGWAVPEAQSRDA